MDNTTEEGKSLIRSIAWRQYYLQRQGTISRFDKNGDKIEFLLSFDEWCDWWIKTGHYHERGRGKDKFCMGRINDVGPYSLDNICCITFSENSKSGNFGREAVNKGKISPLKGIPKSLWGHKRNEVSQTA